MLSTLRWLTANVVDLAQTIRDELAFDRLGILSDALMDAGCDDKLIFERCREGKLLKLGSYVVDLILFKNSSTKEPKKTLAHSLKILVVDDNHEVADKFTWVAETSGYTVRTAYSGKEALKFANEWEPDCVFLSLSMPGMDGYTIARRIRQQSGSNKVALIALSVTFNDTQLQKLREAEFNYHLVKSAASEEIKSIFVKLEQSSGDGT